MSTFGERFKGLRIEKGKTLDEMKDILNTTKSTLSHYENSHRTPKIDFVKKAAEYFGVTTDFLTGKDNKEKENIIKLNEDGDFIELYKEYKKSDLSKEEFKEIMKFVERMKKK